jgi:hypothetical protein
MFNPFQQTHNEKFDLIIQYRPIRQILLDIERYEKKLRETEKLQSNPNNFIDKSEVTLLWMEVVTRKDLLKHLTLVAYEPLLELQTDDKIILQQFFLDLNGFSWKDQFGWIGQTANVSRLAIDPFAAATSLFQGIRMNKSSSDKDKSSEQVVTNDGTVRELILPGNGMEGSNSMFMRNLLKKCVFLNLNWNIISSNISLFSLRSFTCLLQLSLSGNELIGSLDELSFQQLTCLKILDLSFNKLSGDLPPKLFETLESLEKLNLSYNEFTGWLPESLNKLVKLQELKLYHNKFSGEILESMVSSLTELVHVNLSCNK